MSRLSSSRRLLRLVARSLYRLGRARRKLGLRPAACPPRRVVHVSPAYFADESMIGGGERYVTGLAEALAEHVDTTLVSFGDRRRSLRQGRLRLEIYPVIEWIDGIRYNPLGYSFLRELAAADVVHCHQYWTVASALSIAAASAVGKRVFVTDYGGWLPGTVPTPPLESLVDGFLAISRFSAQTLPPHPNVHPIYGGVSPAFLETGAPVTRDRQVLYVGRLLPHKGVNDLVEAIDDGLSLDVVGRVYDPKFFALLQRLAAGKDVRFVTGATDEDIRRAYRCAWVTVLPSVYRDVNGNQLPAPELLGLVLMESMACGTPVICTAVGGMPEIVEDGVTGFVVPPNDPVALRERLHYLVNNPDLALRMGRAGRERVLREYTWAAVVGRCLRAYAAP